MQVSEIMTTGSVAVASHATVAEVWALLRTLGVRQLPVVDEKRQLVGLVSDHELSPPRRPATGDDADDADDAEGPLPNTPVAGLMSASIVFVPLPGSVLNPESGKRSRASTVSTLCCFNILITHDGGWRTSTGSLSSKGFFLAATLPKPKLFNNGWLDSPTPGLL